MTRQSLLVVASVALAIIALGAPVAAASERSDTGDTTGYVVEPGVDTGATFIEPDPSIIDPRPSAWDHIIVSPDGRTLAVYFWMGIEQCYGLHSVSATPRAGGIDLLLMTGTPVGAEAIDCIEIAQLYTTMVTLDQPLIGNTP